MGLGLGSAGFPVAGIQLLVLGAGAFVSNVTRTTGAINAMNIEQEKAAEASARVSRAFKEQVKVRQELLAVGDKAGAARALAAQDKIVGVAINRVQKRARALAVGIAAGMATIVGAGLSVVVRQLRLLADEYQRTEIAAVRVAKNQGITQRAFKDTREAITQQAFTLVQAQTAMTKLTAANVDLSESVRLAAVANDVAISKNLDAAKTYDLLTDAVSRASTRQLVSLDLASRATDVFERFQREMGIVNRELTIAEKRQATLNEIYRQGAKFAGAFADAQNTVGVQTRRQTTEIDTLARRIGAGLIPVFVSMTRVVRSGVRFVAGFNDETLRTAAILVGVAASVITVVGALASLIRVGQLLGPALAIVFSGPWGILIGLLAAAAVAVGLYVAKTQEAKDATEELNKVTAEDTERALERVKNAYIEQQVAVLDAQLQGIADQRDVLEAQIDLLDEQVFVVEQALQKIEDAFFDLEVAELELDKPLFPLMDTLFLIEAQAARVLIPLRRQERAYERTLKVLREIRDEEKDRLEDLIRGLKNQIEDQRELVQLRRDELGLTQHEAFIEDLRNRIRKQATSGQLLELQSQARVQEDILARAQQDLQTLRDKMKDEREHLRIIQEASEKQLEAAEKQLRAIQRVIELEEERVRVHKEDLELARANQAQQRLLIEQQRRILEEREMFTRRDLDMANRAVELLERQLDVLEKQEEILEKTRADLELQITIDPSPLHEVNSILDEIKERMTTEMEESGKGVTLTWEFIMEALRDGWTTFWAWVNGPVIGALDEMFDTFRLWWLTKAVPWLEQQVVNVREILVKEFAKLDWFQSGLNDAGKYWTAFAEATKMLIQPGGFLQFPFELGRLIAEEINRTARGREEERAISLDPFRTVTPQAALVGGGVSSPTIINNYNTIQGPQVDLTANYADVQSESSIRRDLGDVFEFYR